jgi:hypothetical protein
MKGVELGDPLSRQAPQHLADAHRRVLNYATPILLDGANDADLGDALRSSTSAVGGRPLGCCRYSVGGLHGTFEILGAR